VLLENSKLEMIQNSNFRKIAEFECREICAPQNRELNVLLEFYVWVQSCGDTILFLLP